MESLAVFMESSIWGKSNWIDTKTGKATRLPGGAKKDSGPGLERKAQLAETIPDDLEKRKLKRSRITEEFACAGED